MLTVTQLARRCGISRATLLYYEREGLLVPASRGANGYRWYGDREIERLEHIVAYRSYGIPVADIMEILEQKGSKSQAEIMRQHFNKLEQEINGLRRQQKAIVAMLQEPGQGKNKRYTKAQWVDVLRASGFDDEAMLTWHRTFEEMQPEQHQAFLESLGIGPKEIKMIRAY